MKRINEEDAMQTSKRLSDEEGGGVSRDTNKERYKTSKRRRCLNTDNDTWSQHGAPTNSQGDIRGDTEQEKKKKKKIKEKEKEKHGTVEIAIYGKDRKGNLYQVNQPK